MSSAASQTFEDCKRTELVLSKAIKLNILRELVRLAADDDRDRVLLRHHGNECSARTGVDGTIRMYGVCAEENGRYFGDDGAKSGQEEIGAGYTGAAEYG